MSAAGKLAAQKRFALECRQVRLFIFKNPGTNNFTIRETLGFKPGRHLSKMVRMGIIKEEGGVGVEAANGSYYVVPQ